MGSALAVRLARAGHEVLVGSRTRARPWPYPDVPRSTYETALGYGNLGFLALPWPVGPAVLRGLSVPPRRILIDVSNPETPDGMGLTLGLTTSGAEEVARAAPGARVVKAFSHYYAELLHEEPTFDGGTPTVLYCGDDAGAKDHVRRLIESCGLDPVDAGDLAVARYLEPLAMLTVALVRRQGWGPTGVAWRLMRRRGTG